MRIGVDIGGTFTDVTAVDEEGRFHVAKLPSTPADQSVGFRDGIVKVLEQAQAHPAHVNYLAHGTTVATNTLLELTGARVALVVTEGFRDLLEIGRQRRPDLYDLNAEKPTVLVPRKLTWEAPERILASGEARTRLTREQALRIAGEVAVSGVEAVAICFLHSYRNPENEVELDRAFRELAPELYVSRSSEVAPEFREYERISTTVINAFVGPRMRRYVRNLTARAAEVGLGVTPKIIQSSGGLVSPESIIARPVATLLSGPSAGVIGASWVCAASGRSNAITFDMGGTSTDVCLIKNGEFTTTRERAIEGYPVRVLAANVHTVGAGGGSIARVDAAGGMSVGPASAGAVPGPAAYGRGGTEATVTDANVVLGRQLPTAGRESGLSIDKDLAAAAVGRIAERRGGGTVEAAEGIVRIANSQMARAVRAVSVEIGEDPRDYDLVAYGGAGPMHAVEVAREVGITGVVIPPHPGTLCALGLLVSDTMIEFVRSVLVPLRPEGIPTINQTISELLAEGDAWASREGIPQDKRRMRVLLDLRYARQNFELSIEFDGAAVDPASLQGIAEDFHAAHERSYGFRHAAAPVQLVNIAVHASQDVTQTRPTLLAASGDPVDDRALTGTVQAAQGASGAEAVKVYDRERLAAGDRIAGPAIIEQMDSTTWLPSGSSALVDEFGTLLVDTGAGRGSEGGDR